MNSDKMQYIISHEKDCIKKYCEYLREQAKIINDFEKKKILQKKN